MLALGVTDRQRMPPPRGKVISVTLSCTSAVYNADKAYVAVKFDNLVAKVALHVW